MITRKIWPILMAIVLLCNTHLSFCQTHMWARGGGSNSDGAGSSGADNEKVMNMCTDPNGNIYTLSTIGLMGSVYLDGTFITSGWGGSSDFHLLLTSYTCNGSKRFAKYISGKNVYAYGLQADEYGHVYIAFGVQYLSGAYALHIDVDTSFSGSVFSQAALVQYDTSGDFNWLRFAALTAPLGSLGGQDFNNLALDRNGYPRMLLGCTSGVVFRPGDTSAYGYSELMYSPTGDLLSVKHLMMDSTLAISDLSIDTSTGNLFAIGIRSPTFSFPPITSTIHPFLAAFDTNRHLMWIDTTINPFFPNTSSFMSVETDGIGHIYTSLVFPRSVVYRGDTIQNQYGVTGLSFHVSALMKLDTAGNTQWIRRYSSTGSSGMGSGLVILANNRLAVCGSLATGSITGGTYTVTLSPGETNNPIFSILDTGGYVHELEQLHGLGFHDFAYRLTGDRKGNLYVGGQMQTNIWAGSLTPCPSIGGYSDYFVTKYGVNCDCPSWPVANYSYTGIELSRTFAYTGTVAGIDSVRWTFGDGGTSTLASPTHTYTAAGTFTTCIQVYSSCGNDMKCNEITVACSALPVAAFLDTGNLIRGFTYTGTTTTLYDSVRWIFGDGSFDTGLHVVHTYAAGTYTVCAIIYTRCGKDTSCSTITVASGSVSTHVNELESITTYPNPTAESLNVVGIKQPTEYNISNAIGISLLHGVLDKQLNNLQVGKLPPGVYILELRNVAGERKVLSILKR